MGDLTGRYFAKLAIFKAVEWLSKFEPIPARIKEYASGQKKQAENLKSKMIENFNSR